MREIKAKNIMFHRGYSHPHIMCFGIEGHINCKNIKENLEKLEFKYSKEANAVFLKVNWQDFVSEFDIPNNVNSHTIFYMCFCLTIGHIQCSDLNTLNKFIYQCNEVTKSINPSYFENLKSQESASPTSQINTNSFSTQLYNTQNDDLNLDFSKEIVDKFKINIISRYGTVYQFIKKINYQKSKILFN